MIVCKVTGHVWATKKEDSLSGFKLMIVRKMDGTILSDDEIVAVDMVGAGIGERVLVVSGSTARMAAGSDQAPVDAAIVGIVDTLEVDREFMISTKSGRNKYGTTKRKS